MSNHEKIQSLILPESGQSFKGDDFRMLCKPCVYMFMQDGVPLYIGMSRNGLSRPAQYGHLQAAKARSECDEVRVYPCVSELAARELEQILVCRTQPKYNRNGLQSHARQLLGNSLRSNNIKY